MVKINLKERIEDFLLILYLLGILLIGIVPTAVLLYFGYIKLAILYLIIYHLFLMRR